MAEYELSDIQWREKLGRRRYKVLRDKATEPPFTGELLDNKKKGVYRCAGCGKELFTSDTKYDSGSGWPSFYSPIDGEAVEEEEDTELGMRRTEILCSRCGGHLGHVFDDGPKPTGLRYCVNSASLEFEDKE